MKLFSYKQPQPIKLDNEIVDSKEIYRLVKSWNDWQGKQWYYLLRGEQLTWSDGTKGISQFYGQYESKFKDSNYVNVANGNKAWADRTAKQYKISIENYND